VSACRSPPPIASPALHQSVPTRTPVAACRLAHFDGSCQRAPRLRYRAPIAHQRAITVEFIAAIVIERCIAAAQIPIAQHRS